MIRGSQSISDLTNAIEPNSDSRISEHSGAISAQGKTLFVSLWVKILWDIHRQK